MTRHIAFCVVAATATVSLAAQGADGVFERTLSVSGGISLDVLTDAGGILVTKGATGSVHVKGILKAQRGRYSSEAEASIRTLVENPPIEQSADTIRIGHVADKKLLRSVSMRLEITAPAESRLHAQADSGGIRVSGIRGPVDCKTDSGGIETIDIGSDVKASADSGGIRLTNVRGQVIASADSGGIHAIDIAGPVEATTDSGGVRVTQTSPAAIRVRADSGGAEIRLASAGGYDVTASSSSGRVSVSEMTARSNINRHHVEGKIRGGGPLVDVKVDSGHVTIE